MLIKTIKCPKCGCNYNFYHKVCPFCGEPKPKEPPKQSDVDNAIDTTKMVKAAMSLFEEGNVINKAKAIKLFKKAADLNDSNALYILGYFYYKGISPIEKNHTLGSYNINKAIDLGNVDAKIFKITLMIEGAEKFNINEIRQIMLTMNKSDFNKHQSILRYLSAYGPLNFKDENMSDFEQQIASHNNSRSKKINEVKKTAVNKSAIKEGETTKASDKDIDNLRKVTNKIRDVNTNYFGGSNNYTYINDDFNRDDHQGHFVDDYSMVSETKLRGKANNDDNVPIVRDIDVFEEEEINYENFKKDVQKFITKINKDRQDEEPSVAYDEDARINAVTAIRNNKPIVKRSLAAKKDLDNPYFGRIDIYNRSRGYNETYYIGRERIEVDGIVKVYSWRDSIGRLYNAPISQVENIQGKRRITIRDFKLLDAAEIYNKQYGDTYNKLIADEYLLKVLNSRRKEEKISDIIETIQYEQDQIITSPTHKGLVMQGCAGCGKTMILFHRMQYMIGNELDNSNKMCAITPSIRFNELLYPLLYDLGINDVDMYSIEEFYVNVIDEYIPRYRYFPNNPFKAMLKSYKSKYFAFDKVIIKDDSDLPVDVVARYYSDGFINDLTRLKSIKINTLSNLNNNTFIKNHKINLMDALFIGHKLYSLLPTYEKEYGVIHRCELYAICLILFIKCGTNKYVLSQDSSKNHYKFNFDTIFIDEGQDFALNEIKLIKSLGGNDPIIDIFGDLNQSLKSYTISDWNDLTTGYHLSLLYKYNKNYRNTSEMIKFVNEVCHLDMEDIGVSGEPVTKISFNDLAKKFYKDKYKRKAIIVNNSSIKDKFTNEYLFDSKDVYTVSEVKGLEFDSVYVYLKGMGRNKAYVALTRGLSKLTVVE